MLKDARRTAEKLKKPLEEFLMEMLFVYLPLTDDIETQLAHMETYSDTQLRAVIQRRLSLHQENRLKTLSNRVEQGQTLSDSEKLKLDMLVTQVDEQMLL